MVSDDVVYGLLLFLSIPHGFLVRSAPHGARREIVCALSGLVLIALTCKEHILHSVCVTLTNTLLILTCRNSRFLQGYSFLWCFSYLAFFRTCHWYGIPKPSPHSNAVQLIVTLKLVGVAAEVVETERLKRLLKSSTPSSSGDSSYHDISLQLKYKGVDCTWSRLLSYSLCYIGALTGPYYSCRTYQDMLNNKSAKSLPLWSDLQSRLKPLPVCAGLFLALTWLVSVKRAREQSFYEENSALYKWIYLILLFAWFRVRFYSAWILAECMAVTAGLGAYPTVAKNRSGGGPANLQGLEDNKDKDASNLPYDFETIRNTLPYETEVSSNVQHTFRVWNMTVQWWLAAVVYKNLPVRSKLVRGVLLMMVSGFWHGLHPGFYATFLSAPFLLLAETGMLKGLRNNLTNQRYLAVYDWVAWFLIMRLIEFYAVGVFFLFYDEIWRYWSGLYFYGHFLLLTLIFIGQLLSRFSQESPKKLK